MNIEIIFPIKGVSDISQELALEALNIGLIKLIDSNKLKGPIEDILLDYSQSDSGYPIAEIDSMKVIDLNDLEKTSDLTYMAEPIEMQEARESVSESRKFSQATIAERLKIAKRNPKLRLRYIVMDYKNYWKSKKSTLKKNPEQVKHLKNMFLQDLNGIMLEVLPYIGEGKQLAQLIGINQVTQGMNNLARDLSIIYRRALNANEKQGQIPKSIFQKLQTIYNNFMNQLLRSVFVGIDEFIGNESEVKKPEKESKDEVKTESKNKTYSYTTQGRIKLFS